MKSIFSPIHLEIFELASIVLEKGNYLFEELLKEWPED